MRAIGKMQKVFMKVFLAVAVMAVALIAFGSYSKAAEKNWYGDPWGDNGDGTYTNPVLPSDYSDPDAIRVGDDYYLVTSTFTNSKGVAVLHSKDMVNWETISHAIPDVSVLHPSYNWDNMGNYGSAVYAPSIRYHKGMFYVYVPSFKAGGLFVCKSASAAGPWEVTHLKDMNGKPVDQLITDPCPFWDDDGKAYLIFTSVEGQSDLDSGSQKGYPMVLCQMSEDGTVLTDLDASSPQSMMNTGTVVYNILNTEASKIYKRNGYYYLFNCDFAGRSPQGAGSYMKRSRYLYGEHEDGTPGEPGNPGKYEIRFLGNGCPLQGGLIDTPDGKNWYWIAQFNDGSGGAAGGRQVHLVPVTWKDDWPIWGDNGDMVWTAEKPIQDKEVKSFQKSDDFKEKELGLCWQWNHQPRDDKWSLTANPGSLRLYAYKPLRTSDFFSAGNTIFQRYIRTDAVQATYKLDISGMEDGQNAGMVHFNGGGQYYSLGIVQNGSSRVLQFNNNGSVTEGAAIPSSNTEIWFTSLTDENMSNTYYYSFDGINYQAFGSAFTVGFSGYRGDQIGVFNYNNKGENGYIDIDSFEYHYTGPAEAGMCRLADNNIILDADMEGTKSLKLLKADGFGKNEDVTGKAKFVMAHNDIVDIDSKGKITAKKSGKELVSVVYEGQTYLAAVHVTGAGEPVTDEDMVLYYKFDESDGQTVKDYSGNDNSGSYMNNAQWTEGIDNQALKLSGGDKNSTTANYVKLPNTFMKDMESITVNFWVKWTGGPVNQWAFALGGNKDKGDMFNHLFLSPCHGRNGLYTAITNNRYDAEQGTGISSNIDQNEWKMLTVSLNANEDTLKLFENGKLLNTNYNVSLSMKDVYESRNDYAGYIGKSFYEDPYFSGEVDEFRIYEKAMSGKEVDKLYRMYQGEPDPGPDPEQKKVYDVFVDISETDWFVDYVQFVYDHKIMTGLDSTHFGPASVLSRGQFATILYRMEEQPEVEYEEIFPDVPDETFYTKAVIWASSKGIITGYEDHTFGPADRITREQMALMMYRYADYKKYDVSAGEALDFEDASLVSPFAKTAVEWAVATEIISGNLDGTLAPQGEASRAVCATIIKRFQETNQIDESDKQ